VLNAQEEPGTRPTSTAIERLQEWADLLFISDGKVTRGSSSCSRTTSTTIRRKSRWGRDVLGVGAACLTEKLASSGKYTSTGIRRWVARRMDVLAGFEKTDAVGRS